MGRFKRHTGPPELFLDVQLLLLSVLRPSLLQAVDLLFRRDIKACQGQNHATHTDPRLNGVCFLSAFRAIDDRGLDIASVPNFLKQFVQLDSQVNEHWQ